MTRPITSDWTDTVPVPVAHIADYYDRRWESHKCLAWQLLRRGYRQLSAGRIEGCNNLFAVQRSTAPADTARAMHAAEMRGLDMQNYQSHIVGQWVAEAECQRRIDAEREACAVLADEVENGSDILRLGALAAGDSTGGIVHREATVTAKEIAAAIRARGQK